MINKPVLFAVCSSLAFSLGSTALAQGTSSVSAGTPAPEEGEIVVTAQKRSENLQSVPLSITAINGSFLEKRSVTNFQEYAQLVPNISFAYATSTVAGSQSIALRGIFGDGTTGLYLDESPLPGSIDTRIVDLERIEVLRGPQGTLYGARSMGGTVRLITTQPDPDRASVRLHVGGSATKHGGLNTSNDSTANLPIAGDALAVRMSAFYDRDPGVFTIAASPTAPASFSPRDHVGTVEKWGGSIALRSELDDGRLVITPRLLLQRTRYNGRPYADTSPDNFVQLRPFDVDEQARDNYELYTLTGTYDLGFGTITSASSQLNRRVRDTEDLADTLVPVLGLPFTVPSVIRAIGETNAFSQELRFNSAFEGPFQITAGSFYQRTKDRGIIPPTPVAPFTSDLYSTDHTKTVSEYALFAEAGLKLTSTITATVGGRYFKNRLKDHLDLAGALNTPGSSDGAQKEKGFNPKFNVRYEPSRDLTVYANAAKGFRIGGVNQYPTSFCGPFLPQIGLRPGDAASFKSDSVWSYEVGAKAALLDRRVRLSGAVFQIDWNDVQQNVVIPNCGFRIGINAGKARNRGFEFEGSTRLVGGLSAGFGLGYTDAKIVDAGSTVSTINVGDRVQQVPHWTLNGNIVWEFDVSSLPAYFNADYSYVGSSYSAFNDVTTPRLRPSYETVNVRAGIKPGALDVSIFVKNLFNKHANYADVPPLGIEVPGRPRIATNRPITIGVDLRASF